MLLCKHLLQHLCCSLENAIRELKAKTKIRSLTHHDPAHNLYFPLCPLTSAAASSSIYLFAYLFICGATVTFLSCVLKRNQGFHALTAVKIAEAKIYRSLMGDQCGARWEMLGHLACLYQN